MLIQQIMHEDKQECWKDPEKDGMVLIPYTLVHYLKKNKDTEITLKLI